MSTKKVQSKQGKQGKSSHHHEERTHDLKQGSTDGCKQPKGAKRREHKAKVLRKYNKRLYRQTMLSLITQLQTLCVHIGTTDAGTRTAFTAAEATCPLAKKGERCFNFVEMADVVQRWQNVVTDENEPQGKLVGAEAVTIRLQHVVSAMRALERLQPRKPLSRADAERLNEAELCTTSLIQVAAALVDYVSDHKWRHSSRLLKVQREIEVWHETGLVTVEVSKRSAKRQRARSTPAHRAPKYKRGQLVYLSDDFWD